jgi:hypothetical protein
VLTATNKRLLISESHDDLNWCTPCRGNPIHMTRTLLMLVHVCHTYACCGQSSYVATFHIDPIELDRFTASEKSALDSTSQPGSVTHGTHISFSPKHSHWSSVLRPNICWRICYISLLGPYHQHEISTFNTCSREPTHRSLTDTGGGYNLVDAGLPHHTPWPSQPMILDFPPKAPAQPQINIQQLPTELKRGWP